MCIIKKLDPQKIAALQLPIQLFWPKSNYFSEYLLGQLSTYTASALNSATFRFRLTRTDNRCYKNDFAYDF